MGWGGEHVGLGTLGCGKEGGGGQQRRSEGQRHTGGGATRSERGETAIFQTKDEGLGKAQRALNCESAKSA